MTEATQAEVLAYVALGGNLGDARATVQQALAGLASLPATRLLRASSLYRTAPMQASGPDFINAVAAVATRLSAFELLAALQQMENAQGRERPYVNAPRTLDLDILLYGDTPIHSPTLQVPHPRMYQRAFVLVPLAEIAPQLVSVEQLAAVQEQQVECVQLHINTT
ncbi:2-amino-4-hydroxy-6-hydroxymethyldihydropteridine diphosphokinase [Rhodoferax sp. U11-2br]|uniref:2-amino-4-hydroxy-6- hydroxymethyldihydropteridine diphosphokinase n=1 Tax=Rhodoferax sp. U11-2br TaxID=2838878 RepID=UPI001BEBF989|nr:2-amino-4-hydroxy-6-hydroxymethyldihydropteridine diphosphokinase [Rhodoferax sp. U11-2br]MBT3069229.1 2-amino-4-hydroxy-6-hydroxymethyldihydropteridine diphosphokinase [Rhodoferax sp. U11-2br]